MLSTSSSTTCNRDRTTSTSYMNQEQFDKIFQFQPSPTRKSKNKFKKYFKPLTSIDNFIHFLLNFIPILKWLPEYEWKQNIVGDMMAGLTVGVVHVPQGIAYAILTGVDPVYGLYTSFFGVILYMIFGTSKYVSVGSFAIISLMTGVSCRQIKEQIENDYLEAEGRYIDNANVNHLIIDINNLTSIVNKIEVNHTELVQLVTLISGLIQIIMGLLRVEFLASYLSDQLVNGFCTGAAIHVVVVQINKLLQVNVTKFSGPGYLIRHLIDLFNKILTTNIIAMIISLCGFIFLYIGKDVIGARLRKYLPAPIPFELLLVVITTAVSALFNFEQTENITVVKDVPVGLPVAKIPRLELIPYVIGPAFEIAFVVVALHLSMCKVFNRKLGSKTDNNQELYAMGILASLSSFFNTYPISSSLGRSMLNVECGAKTQLSSFFTALLLLVVILFLGPLLSTLPMCILAVIIIYSMKGVFQKMPYELAQLWKVAKIDFIMVNNSIDGDEDPGLPGEPIAAPPGQLILPPPGEANARPPGEPIAAPPGQLIPPLPREANAGPPGEPIAAPPGQLITPPPGEANAGPPGEPIAAPPGQLITPPPGEANAGPPGEPIAAPPGQFPPQHGEANAGPPGEPIAAPPGQFPPQHGQPIPGQPIIGIENVNPLTGQSASYGPVSGRRPLREL